jgi:hypothetical protein
LFQGTWKVERDGKDSGAVIDEVVDTLAGDGSTQGVELVLGASISETHQTHKQQMLKKSCT